MTQSAPVVPLDAVERLEQIREHQAARQKEIIRNWPGWLGSLALHVAVILLMTALAAGGMEAQKEWWLETDMQDIREDYTNEPMDKLFEDSVVESDINDVAEVDAHVLRPNPGYNEGTPGAPGWLTSGGHLAGLGDGGGGGEELAGKSFRGVLRGLQKSGLEVMFVFDSTGSMGGIILEVKSRIRYLMKVVNHLVPNARIGFVTYRDRKKFDLDDYEYTVKYIPLMTGGKDGVDKLQRFLRETEAYGGGDIPEAVLDGVQTAIEKAGWTPRSRKIIIVFGDAPPRPEDNGLSKMFDLCRKWKDAPGGGILSTIDTTGGSKLMDEFKQMAADGGGEATFLNDQRGIVKQLVVLIFGSRWKDEIDKVCESVTERSEDTVVPMP